MKNRAQRAIDFLRAAPNRTLTSYQLNTLLHTNFSPRAICEARKLGFTITGVSQLDRSEKYTLHEQVSVGGRVVNTLPILIDNLHDKTVDMNKPVQHSFSFL